MKKKKARKRPAAKRARNTKRKIVKTTRGAGVAVSLAKERAKVRELRAEVQELKRRRRTNRKKPRRAPAKRRNPRRPPGRWWNRCLRKVEASKYARDPSAVCGKNWWRKPPAERAAIVRKLERSRSPRHRRAAYAIARAERDHAYRGRGGKRRRPREHNPPRKLLELVYIEQKPGDDEEIEYVHTFRGRLPDVRMRGGKLQIEGGTYRTKDGWIEG